MRFDEQPDSDEQMAIAYASKMKAENAALRQKLEAAEARVKEAKYYAERATADAIRYQDEKNAAESRARSMEAVAAWWKKARPWILGVAKAYGELRAYSKEDGEFNDKVEAMERAWFSRDRMIIEDMDAALARPTPPQGKDVEPRCVFKSEGGFVCGHTKAEHIYHEGACRPGFLCPARCPGFVAPAPPESVQEPKEGTL